MWDTLSLAAMISVVLTILLLLEPSPLHLTPTRSSQLALSRLLSLQALDKLSLSKGLSVEF